MVAGEARDWAAEELQRRGVGELRWELVHAKPWSTVWRGDAAQGTFFLKASAEALAHEGALTAALATWRPDVIQTVLAVESARSWLLLPDESPSLRELVASPADLWRWERVLPRYAALQQDLVSRAGDLLALGVPDRRLAILPTLFAKLLDDVSALLIDDPDGLTSEHVAGLRAAVPRVAEMCAELAAIGLPETLQHDDFHDANVFVPGGRDVLSDWGESCLAHPFFSLLVTIRSAGHRLGLPFGALEHGRVVAPELERLLQAYLSAWEPVAAPDALRRAWGLARPLAMINRALTWHRVLVDVEPAQRAPYAASVPGWLGEFLDELDASRP